MTSVKNKLEKQIGSFIESLYDVKIEVELTRPDEKFGDYSTNAALQLSKQLGKNPREIGEALAEQLRTALADEVQEVSVAGPGFINLKLTDSVLIDASQTKPSQVFAGQEVLVEFGDPNPFKAMHIGHLYSYIVGDAICSLLETAGATVRRLSYHGDVGLHVAKAIWAMQQANDASSDIGTFYAQGAQAYAEEGTAKEQIDAINQQIYAHDPAVQQLYEDGKQQSFTNFDEILKTLGIINDRRYFESESAQLGLETVKQNVGKAFIESDGAVVYEGEKVGLHTRVFITSKGLPTYETKDLGLTEMKAQDYPNAARSIIVTANEQAEYFKVMLAALKEIDEALAAKTEHRTHGFVSLSSGKMSSRTGDVYNAVKLIEDVKRATDKLHPGSSLEIKLGAIKYAFTKHRLGGDLVYDIEESVSLEGNSGPYLQYAHARAQSILARAAESPHTSGDQLRPEAHVPDEAHSASVLADHPKLHGATRALNGVELEPEERLLVRKISEYSEVIDEAVAELMPHHVCTYLYELAQSFNRFYEQNRVVGNEREALRLSLVKQYAEVLKAGLNLLGIAAPDKM